MRLSIYLSCLIFAFAPVVSASAKSVEIDVDTAMATRLLDITCSNKSIDRAEFASSALLGHQLDHHKRFGEVYSLDNYVAGVRAISTCKVPDPDPFRMRFLVEKRTQMRNAINFLAANRQKIGREVSALIIPYVPDDMDFKGDVVLAAASFSRGGFASGGAFFIDIPGMAEDVEADYESIVRLIAHETYHSIQAKLAESRPALGHQAPSDAAIRELFDGLVREGSATFVGDPTRIKRVGPYGSFDQEEAKRGLARLPQTANMLNFAIELLNARADDDRLEQLYGLVFGGRVGQPGYYLGQQMSAEIVNDFGAKALPCLLSRNPEYFVLAYGRAYKTGTPLKASVALGGETLKAAQELAGAGWQARLRECAPVP